MGEQSFPSLLVQTDVNPQSASLIVDQNRSWCIIDGHVPSIGMAWPSSILG